MTDTPPDALNPDEGAPPALPDPAPPGPRVRHARQRQAPVPGEREPGYGRFAPGWVTRTARSVARALPQGEAGLRLAGALAPAALAAHKDQAVDVQAFGLALRLYPRASLSEKRAFLTPQCFDPHELDALREVMGAGKTFIDAGAEAGLYALVAARAGGPACRVIAVEPRREHRQRLAFNALQNALSRIEITGLALADYEGERVQRIVTGAPSTGGEAVRVTTLPGLMDAMRVDRVHALRLDSGGAEAAVLGAFFAETGAARWPELLILRRALRPDAQGPDAVGLARGRGYSIVKTTRRHHILHPA
ncbi:FkbM family methyltransferase [Alkalicaulis satelles]|uniref:FkbM family methyltransferase n=1 Tax=Alkalicaulis satelles TaxID=2609175 RepID=A0A5M6ZN16_9PROT|nr:FkbM family methyltransferase [Alkalicaulis satelles]KAA5804974.1 FkbM family methyltransferase [Alkalicaulis satelles]